MTAHLPLHLTLIFWCMLDMSVNAFILANLVLCQELISEGMFNSKSTYPYPTIVVRVCAFVALVVVLLGDILNLIGIYFRSLTLIIFWQLSFMLYFILAYATLIASFISTLQAIVDFEVRFYVGLLEVFRLDVFNI